MSFGTKDHMNEIWRKSNDVYARLFPKYNDNWWYSIHV